MAVPTLLAEERIIKKDPKRCLIRYFENARIVRSNIIIRFR
jgi:hypothetical protein